MADANSGPSQLTQDFAALLTRVAKLELTINQLQVSLSRSANIPMPIPVMAVTVKVHLNPNAANRTTLPWVLVYSEARGGIASGLAEKNRFEKREAASVEFKVPSLTRKAGEGGYTSFVVEGTGFLRETTPHVFQVTDKASP